jgi:hypothetical protein
MGLFCQIRFLLIIQQRLKMRARVAKRSGVLAKPRRGIGNQRGHRVILRSLAVHELYQMGGAENRPRRSGPRARCWGR